ncbi:MGT family glycosyltransferase [Solirubrobacter pauli]|uniref:MGT family glycosyltransferase n=1 Tax=Solirubrobacter pauli TaxID=166793 RepID=A0A660KZ79_9ACTN|nr:glycosyltransferase [Solirubrobacter pauli]RKQ86997.1 MGT family glycosyltransferase [Solirubrobacter pauli]
MRILVTTTGSPGHVGPLLPFLDAIRAAGGETLVATRSSLAHTVAAHGYAAWPVGEARAAERAAAFAAARGLSSAAANEHALTEVFAGLDARAALAGTFDAIAGWRPDVVLSEASEFAGRVAAAHVGLPFVKLSITQYAVEHDVLPATDAALARLRATHGLRAAGGARSAQFTLLPPLLERPGQPGPPGLQRFREREAPSAGRSRRSGTDPLVYLTFGTAAPQMGCFPERYRSAIDALALLPIQLLVTTGRDRDPGELGATPANVQVRRWADHAEVLGRASAVVCHGGTGTVRGALAAGVPLVITPMFADQLDNAVRVHALGAGVHVQHGQTGLADAVRAVLGDRRYADRAATVAADIRALPTVDRAASVLRGWAARAAA